ncbi:MAG: signal peptidase II [Candidatus Rokubacteria bacterium]|nr:signal peptidase II [Candidatus Rokubacteria bacterium]
MRRAVAVGVAVLALDQATKLLALARLSPGHPVSVVDGLLALTLVLNPGLAFGMLAAVPPGWRWVVALLSLAALCALGLLALQLLPGGGWSAAFPLGLVFGGALGNLVDRWRFGAVVDFIDAYWRAYHWPAFNVADSAISVGVALLALRLLTRNASPPA